MYATITAGGRVDGAFAAAIGTSVKALAPCGRGRMIDAAIEAARGAGVEGIALVGGEEVRAYCGARVDRFIPESASGFTNIKNAIEAWGGERVLYLTSDVPFVSASALRDFTARASDAVAAIPLAAAQDYERAFLDAPPHVMTLGGRRFASGSVFVLLPGALEPVWPIVQGLFEGRKNAFAMARVLGPALLARFLLRRLRVDHVERRATRVLGGPVRAVWDADPGLCYDVDSEIEWEYAASRLRHG